ncbi:MAG: TIGR00297 family protein, partial [Cyanobacteria bacterium K_DeepCast_35m_m2_023]|nr:TIGR00297 family protein [Cyanobacteria bacterium K_DeepCast_35m_m2_023]
MALICALLGLLATPAAVVLVTLVALVATLIESAIGATLQRRHGWLSNELVNGLQTAIAAGLAMAAAGLLALP